MKAIKFSVSLLILLPVFVIAFFATTAIFDYACRTSGYYEEGLRESMEVGLP